MIELSINNIERSADFLYYVAQTYNLIENKEYVGRILNQVVEDIEEQTQNILSELQKEKSMSDVNHELKVKILKLEKALSERDAKIQELQKDKKEYKRDILNEAMKGGDTKCQK